MVHFTIFGGSEVTLGSGGKCIVTLFGGTDVRKPTLAKRLMQEKHLLSSHQAAPGKDLKNVDKVLMFLGGNYPAGQPGSRRSRSNFILTICGGVEIKPPSIAEEFMDMRELMSSGLISEAEWDQLVGRLYQMGEMDSISSFTLFGAMGEGSLSEEEEIKKIHSARELGLIDTEEERALRSVVGRDPQQVRMLLRQTAFT